MDGMMTELTIVIQTVSLVEINDVEGISGRGLHAPHTEVVPLYMFAGVEVKVQHQAVLMCAAVGVKVQ